MTAEEQPAREVPQLGQVRSPRRVRPGNGVVQTPGAQPTSHPTGAEADPRSCHRAMAPPCAATSPCEPKPIGALDSHHLALIGPCEQRGAGASRIQTQICRLRGDSVTSRAGGGAYRGEGEHRKGGRDGRKGAQGGRDGRKGAYGGRDGRAGGGACRRGGRAPEAQGGRDGRKGAYGGESVLSSRAGRAYAVARAVGRVYAVAPTAAPCRCRAAAITAVSSSRRSSRSSATGSGSPLTISSKKALRSW